MKETQVRLFSQVQFCHSKLFHRDLEQLFHRDLSYRDLYCMANSVSLSVFSPTAKLAVEQ